MVLIALVGVHGSGKTTLAKLLAESCRGIVYWEVEAIHEAAGLEPLARQLLFFTKYVESYLRAWAASRGSAVVVADSHPLVVPAYTRWWVGDPELVKLMEAVLEKLPPADVLVHIRVEDPEVIAERVAARGRPTAREEADLEYIDFIGSEVARLVERYGRLVARNVLEIDAEAPLHANAAAVASAARIDGRCFRSTGAAVASVHAAAKG
ncbi:MAG: AAA family ATPase [Thermoproteota archaeon]